MSTAVSLPASSRGETPACSSASQLTSSASRCCGSITSASRGETPKNSASKPGRSSRNVPSRVTSRSTAALRGSRRR